MIIQLSGTKYVQICEAYVKHTKDHHHTKGTKDYGQSNTMHGHNSHTKHGHNRIRKMVDISIKLNKATQSLEISCQQVQKLTPQFFVYIYWI